MNYMRLTRDEFARLYPELREPQQIALPGGGGAFHVGHHPLYGRTTLVLDGERYGLVASQAGDSSRPHSHPSAAMDDGAAWASLVALGGMLQGA